MNGARRWSREEKLRIVAESARRREMKRRSEALLSEMREAIGKGIPRNIAIVKELPDFEPSSVVL